MRWDIYTIYLYNIIARDEVMLIKLLFEFQNISHENGIEYGSAVAENLLKIEKGRVLFSRQD